jgi:lipopolysaccharide heptosyltransferase I
VTGAPMNRILVVRLGALGDLVHTLPAVAAIRHAHPDAAIEWLVDASHRDLLALVPVISSLVVLGDRTVGGWLKAVRELRGRKYDAALDFQGLLKSAALARLSGARRVIGFDRAALREGTAAPFYTEQVEVGEGQHVIEKNLKLASAVGAAHGAPYEFPLAPVHSEASAAIAAQGIDRYALINPGAAWPNKRWPPESFGQIARMLRQKHQLRSVVLWGPGEESIAAAVVAASQGAAVQAPRTTLADVVALARRASLFVSGDTGPLHIAAAVGTPVVGLFGPTTARRNGPWNRRDLTISRYDGCDCHYERRCKRSTTWCLGQIPVGEVAAAIDARLLP